MCKTIYHFYQKKMKIERVQNLVASLHSKNEYFIHIINLKQALNHGLDYIMSINDLPLLLEKTNIERAEKLVSSLHNESEYFVHIRNLKQALNHGLVLEETSGVTKFKQKAWLKSNIEMNTGLRKTTKKDFQKDLFKLMNNSLFGKTMENLRKHKEIKLVTTENRRIYLVSEQNYYSTKFFTENLLAIEMRKTQISMNKAVFLGLSRFELSKMIMYKYLYDYVKPKYGEKAKL